MTPFQQTVLDTLQLIPRGKVVTYGQIAKLLNTKAYQAIGQALKANPHPITTPCHRVIKSDLTLGGYLGTQTKIKKSLLESEGVEFQNNTRVAKSSLFNFQK